MARPRPVRLGSGFEILESRDLPTAYGVPWADPGHLTLSFVPDGTPTPAGPSVLFQSMNRIAPAATWQREILRAFETWAEQVNVDVGVVADGGQPLGSLGAVQGDRRFGDIRIAAAPISGDELAAASPFTWTGTTFAGDVVFDADSPIAIGDDGFDLYSIALHEAGHVLGLPHSADAGSVVHEGYGYQTGLSASDVNAVRALYGVRVADAFDAAKPNNTQSTATSVPRDASIGNRLTARADLTTAADVDFYKVTVPLLGGLTGVSVRLTAAGQSLLAPSVTVYSSTGRVVASASSTDPLRNDLTVNFGTSLLGGTYYVKVDQAGRDFATGAYQLTVDFLTLGSLLSPVTNLLAPVLDGHGNDLLGLATILAPQVKPAPDARFDFAYRGAIEDAADVDNYKVRAPVRSAPTTLNVIVWGLDATPLNPRVRVFDSAGRPVAFQVLANDTGLFSLQVPDAAAGAEYYIQVAARSPGRTNGTGGYFLGADFSSLAPATYDGLTSGTLAPAATVSDSLAVAEAGLFEFALAADAGQAGGAANMTVLDSTGRTVFVLTAEADMPSTTTVRYLPVGDYTVRYNSSAASGTSSVALNFNLALLKLSDPVGPYATTTTSTSPMAPTPTGTTSTTSAANPPTTTSTPPPAGGGGYTYTSNSVGSPPVYWYTF